MNQVWDQIIEKLREKISPQSFKNWIEPVKPLSMTDSILEIGIPNDFYEEWFHDNYTGLIKTMLFEMTGKKMELSFKSGAVKEPLENIS